MVEVKACPDCKGSGQDPDKFDEFLAGKMIHCKTCFGQGFINRVFKFRAKNLENGKLYYSDDIGMATFWKQVVDGIMVNVQQYIGAELHEIPIYEGDIIHYDADLTETGGFLEHTHVVEYGEYCDPDGNMVFAFSHSYGSDSELARGKIIGNIVETPELIPKRD
ncbi:hypothetical protein KAU43_04155 [candidate division WOR-3 bacterium]|nr:hypothetical protein [candidate division WOR-3 bacterium]